MGGKTWACLYFFLYHEQEMRGTLIIPMSNLVPGEVEIILSLNEYVLSLHNMLGAEDIMVKKIHMALTSF